MSSAALSLNGSGWFAAAPARGLDCRSLDGRVLDGRDLDGGLPRPFVELLEQLRSLSLAQAAKSWLFSSWMFSSCAWSSSSSAEMEIPAVGQAEAVGQANAGRTEKAAEVDGMAIDLAADQADLRLALQGDQQAYARLVSRYQATIGGQMWRFTREQAVYEELVHDVFVEAYFGLHKFRGDAPLVHWLRRIATRVGYRYWKQRSRRRVEQPLTAAQAAVLTEPQNATPVVSDAAEAVYRLLGQLPPRDRLVLTLLYWDGCSVAEAADLTGWSQTMVKVQAFRARRKMKKLLESATKPKLP